MKFRFGPIVIPALLVLFAGALYLPRRDTPSYLAPDEVFSALTAHSVASTGRDLNGRFMPLYFQLPDSFETRMWYQPIVVYAIAGSLKVLPFSESTIRLPMALAAVLDILLAYCVGRVLFRKQTLAVAAAALLALTPAHFSDSRVAMDHHAFLPFILGWLLCLLMYVERNKPYLLFAAGLALGVGVFTYVASYVFMPAYLLLTGLVLYRRREPWSRFGVLAAGFLLPVLVGASFVVTHPTVVRDTLWRYQRNEPQAAGSLTLLRSFLNSERVAKVGAVYWSFWQPRLLFINGPRSIWVAGQFVLPVAGLLVAGALRMLRRPDMYTVLLLAGLLIAPIPASFVGEPEVIRRAAAVMPFAILLAIAGLEYVWTAETARTRRLVFVAVWGTVIGLAAMYYNDLPHAQALVRASTVPLAVTGLALLVSQLPFDRISLRQVAAVSIVVLVAMHGLYVVADRATNIGVMLLAAIGLATLLSRPPAWLAREPLRNVALLALVAGHFMYVYVDYGQLPRVGSIPASVVILAARLAVASFALAAAIGVARLISSRVAPKILARPSTSSGRAEASFARGEPVEPGADRLTGWRLVAAVSVCLVAVQLSYFSVDYFTDYRWRAVHAAVVLAAAVGLAVLVRGGAAARVQLGPIAAVGLLVVAALQFAPFYADYFTGFRTRGGGAPGSERDVFEAVIDRTREAPVPAIYLGWPYALGDLYWRFYQIKHHREDLESRTIPDLDFKPERIRTLPRGSLVITTPSRTIDAAIDDMMTRGELKKRALFRDIDGTPTFWILETVR